MAHIIEAAKSGRASCRTCKKPIAKGELRLGEEVANPFAAGELTHVWHHLKCAAKKKPGPLKAALEAATIEIPNRAELENMLGQAAQTDKPSTFPYAERAPTARSTCMQCNNKIGKGELRIAIEREVDTGTFVTKGAGYLHPACAIEHTGDDAEELFMRVTANSPGLDNADIDALRANLA